MTNIISLLILTGPVGVGKSSVSEAAYNILVHKGIGCAVIDVDAFRSAYPPPVDDRFNINLVFKNLASVWPNYAALGIKNLIIPNVIESIDELEQYKRIIPDSSITVIRLFAGIPTLHKRLERRESGDSLKWHKSRAIELHEQFKQSKIESIEINTENMSIDEEAHLVINEWLGIE